MSLHAIQRAKICGKQVGRSLCTHVAGHGGPHGTWMHDRSTNVPTILVHEGTVTFVGVVLTRDDGRQVVELGKFKPRAHSTKPRRKCDVVDCNSQARVVYRSYHMCEKHARWNREADRDIRDQMLEQQGIVDYVSSDDWEGASY